MTDAGKITLGVEIDARNLTEKLAAEVRKQLAPVLAQVQKDLDKSNTGIKNLDLGLDDIARAASGAASSTDDMGKATEKATKSAEKATKAADRQAGSVDKLSASTRRLKDAQDDVNTSIGLFGPKSRETEAAVKRLAKAHSDHTTAMVRTSSESSRASRSQIDDFERIAAAAERSARRQIQAAESAARAAVPGPGFGVPTPRSGGGGRGGGRGFGGGGGGGRGGGGRFGGALGTGLISAGALAIDALPAAATVVTNLAGAIQQLAGAGLAIPGVFAGVASSVGTAAIGFSGMGDAIKALNKAAGEGASKKDLEKAAASIKDMAPAAVEVAKTIVGDTIPALKHLRADIQQPMFEGVAAEIKDLTGSLLPTVTKGFGGIATAWNGTFKQLGATLGSDSTKSFLDRIFGNTADAQTRANAAIDPLVHAFGTLAATGSDFLPRLADGLTGITTRFDNFITKAGADGRLDKWINEGIDGFGHLGETVLNIGKIFTDLTGAAGGDGGFLKWLEDVTTKLHAFLSSPEGQEKLTNFFNEGKEKLAEWKPIIENIGTILGNIFDASQQWSAILLPVIRDVTGAFAGMGDVLTGLLVGFAAFKTIKLFGGMLDGIAGLGRSFAGLPDTAEKAGRDSASRLSGALRTAGWVALGAEVADSIFGEFDKHFGSHLQDVGLPGSGTWFFHLLTDPKGTIQKTFPGIIAPDKINFPGGLGGDANAQRERRGAAPIQGGEAGAQRERQGAPPITVPGDVAPSLADITTQAVDAQQKINQLGDLIAAIPPGKVALDQDTPAAIDAIKTLIDQVTHIPGGTVAVALKGLDEANAQMRSFVATWSQTIIAPRVIPGTPGATVGPVGAGSLLAPAGWAGGGVIRGYAGGGVVGGLRDIPPWLLNSMRTRFGNFNPQVPLDTSTAWMARPADSVLGGFGNAVPGAELPEDWIGWIKWMQEASGSGGLHAVGGVLPGYSPGVDNMLVPMSGGEGVVIPEAMRALGSGWLYGINSSFRGGISRRGYADGGLNVDGGTGFNAGTSGDSVVGLLSQIRDLLAGKTTGSPLTTTADGISNLADNVTSGAGKGRSGGDQIGPFGTPIKHRDIGYEAAAGAISALGGDPEKFLGANPADFQPAGGGLPGGVGGFTRPPVDFGRYSSVLSAFATSGNLGGDLAGLGLDANDPVIKAIAAARNKKKGGLDDTAIADLVSQVVGGGGFTGTLDPTNTALITSLQTFHDKLAKKGGVGPGASGVGLGAPLSGNAQALIAFAQGANGGQYAPASDLANGLADCSGAVSDLVELLTKGKTSPDRLFSTDNEASVLQSLGAVPGLVPGTLQIGVSPSHTAATLPNGVNFESGGSGGGGVVYGGPVGAGDRQFTQQFSLPTDISGLIPTAPGLPGPNLATSGAPVPVWIVGGGAIPGQAPGQGGLPGLTQGPLNALIGAGGGAAGTVAGDIVGALGSSDEKLPKAIVDAQQLWNEQNPNAFASIAGLAQVPDFTKQGGGPDAQNLMKNQGPGFDATGRLFSDTSSIIDRTFTSLAHQLQAQHDQEMEVLNQVKDRLSREVLQPIVEDAVRAGFSSISKTVQDGIGKGFGEGAGPPIAAAIAPAISAASSGGGATPAADFGSSLANLGGSAFGFLASGGEVYGGTPGKDSVPIMAQQGEWMLNTDDVRRMGGTGGVARFVGALRNGGIRGFATGGGVNVNDTVGAEFFGVSQIPIIGTIVNILISILLKVIGVNIEARDTLDEISKDFKGFRGEFKGFTATGRLLNDTSGLVDRSSSNEQEVVDERLRILKQVLVGLVKYIIEKVVVPITKAVLNALIQAGGAAAGGALDVVAPGAGGIVSSLIGSAGSAGVDVLGDVIGSTASAGSGILINSLTDQAHSFFGDALTPLLSGGVEGIASQGGIGNVFSSVLSGIFGAGGGIPALLSGALGGLFGQDGGLTGILGGLLGGTGGAGGLLDGLLGGGNIFGDLFNTFFGGGGLSDILGGLFGSGTGTSGGGQGGIGGIFTSLLGGGLSQMFAGLLGGGTDGTGGGGIFSLFSNLFGGALGNLFGGATQASSGVPGTFNNMAGGLFGNLFGGLGNAVSGLLGGLFGGPAGGFGAIFGSLFTGLSSIFAFDSGGVASGVGLMPKATIRPERVLSPRQTSSFDRLVDILDGGNFGATRTTTVHAPIYANGPETAQQVRNGLLSLLDR